MNSSQIHALTQEIASRLGIQRDDRRFLIQEAIERHCNSPDGITISWTVDDVQTAAEEEDQAVTDEEAREILAELKQKHDAEIGINWEVIKSVISNYFSFKENSD